METKMKLSKSEVLFKFLKEDRSDIFGGSHDIHTPQPLAEDILDQIPDIDNDKTILVLFNVEFVISLVYNYNINTKNITFYSDNSTKTKFVNRMGVVNVITELDTTMKFDVVVGNPPYQHPTNKRWKLWVNFIKKSIEISKPGGIVSLVTPSAWINAHRSSGSELFSAKTIINDKQILAYNDIDQSVFGVGEKLGWFVVKNTNGNNEAFFQEKKTISDTIVEKTSGNNYKFVCRLTQLSDRDDNSKLLCYHSAANRFMVNDHRKNKEQSSFKIIVNRSGYYQVEVFGPEVIAGRNSSAILFDTIEKANNAANIFKSKLFQFVNSATKTSGFNKIELLPEVDLYKKWTDSELYIHFNLTQEEIGYIEANIK